MIVDKNMVIASVALVVRFTPRKEYWLLVREDEEGDWTFPKITKRKVESSVKAVIRLMQEKANMDAKVIEEAGRRGSMATVDGKTVSKRVIYYSMVERSSGEAIGFTEQEWVEYAIAIRKLKSKRDRDMLKIAREQTNSWYKDKKRREKEEEELLEMSEE